MLLLVLLLDVIKAIASCPTGWIATTNAGQICWTQLFNVSRTEAAEYCASISATLPQAFSNKSWSDIGSIIEDKVENAATEIWWLGLSAPVDRKFVWDSGFPENWGAWTLYQPSYDPYNSGYCAVAFYNSKTNASEWAQKLCAALNVSVLCQKDYTEDYDPIMWSTTENAGDLYLASTKTNIVQARRRCEQFNATLPVIRSAAAAADIEWFIKSRTKVYPIYVWLGLTDAGANGTLIWEDGLKAGVTDFVEQFYPTSAFLSTNDAIVISMGAWNLTMQWVSTSYWSARNVVCQRNAPFVPVIPLEWVPTTNAGDLLYTGLRLTFEAGRNVCASHGGQLPVIRSPEAWTDLETLIYQKVAPVFPSKQILLGLSDRENGNGTLIWEDGTPEVWAMWHGSHPFKSYYTTLNGPVSEQSVGIQYQLCGQTTTVVTGGPYIPLEWTSTTLNGDLLMLKSQQLHFNNSRARCAQLGGHLPVVYSQDAWAEMRSFALSMEGGGFWIGLSDEWDNGTLHWEDGELETGWSAWKSGHPATYVEGNKQNCFFEANSLWRGSNCGGARRIICQRNQIGIPSPLIWTTNALLGDLHYTQQSITVDNAKSRCEQLGATLPVILTQQDWDEFLTYFLNTIPGPSRSAWLALSGSGMFKWDNSTPEVFHQWAWGEPDYMGGNRSVRAVEISPGIVKWESVRDNSEISSVICQKSNAPDPGVSEIPWNKTEMAGFFYSTGQGLDHENAETRCKQLGGTLPILRFNEAWIDFQSFLDQTIGQNATVWLGLKNFGTEFFWQSSRNVEFEVWANNEPDTSNECTITANGEWKTADCNDTNHVICQRDHQDSPRNPVEAKYWDCIIVQYVKICTYFYEPHY